MRLIITSLSLLTLSVTSCFSQINQSFKHSKPSIAHYNFNNTIPLTIIQPTDASSSKFLEADDNQENKNNIHESTSRFFIPTLKPEGSFSIKEAPIDSTKSYRMLVKEF